MLEAFMIIMIALTAVVVAAVLVLYPFKSLPFFAKMYGQGHLDYFYKEKNKELDLKIHRMMDGKR